MNKTNSDASIKVSAKIPATAHTLDRYGQGNKRQIKMIIKTRQN